MTVRVNGVETVWEGGYGGARDRSSGQVSSGVGEGHGVETVGEGGYGGARDRSSGQVSSGVGEGHGVETVWEGGYGGARERNSAQVSSGDGEGKWGGNSMGRRLRRSARSVPVRCRAVTVRANGMETVWEGGYGGFFFGSVLLGSSPGRSALQSAE